MQEVRRHSSQSQASGQASFYVKLLRTVSQGTGTESMSEPAPAMRRGIRPPARVTRRSSPWRALLAIGTFVLTLLWQPASLQAAPELDLMRLEQQAEGMPRLHSLLISQHGEMVYERYFNGRTASQAANLKSASKSIISALIGIALDHGYLDDIDQPLSDFFPEYADTELSERLATIKVRNLLTMQAGLTSTSGRNYGRWVVNDDWVDAALRAPMIAEPGTGPMIYSTGSTHLLSAIIERASG